MRMMDGIGMTYQGLVADLCFRVCGWRVLSAVEGFPVSGDRCLFAGDDDIDECGAVVFQGGAQGGGEILGLLYTRGVPAEAAGDGGEIDLVPAEGSAVRAEVDAVPVVDPGEAAVVEDHGLDV